MFKAIMISKDEAGQHVALTEVGKDRLPEGDVTVRGRCSTLNYKDALAITGKGPVVRKFPMVPGIDLAGVVERSDHPGFRAGDNVVLNGWGVGEVHWGGLAEYARLKGDWLVPLEPAFSPEQAMSIGTAGYTAMLCVMALERHGVAPESGRSAAGTTSASATRCVMDEKQGGVEVAGQPPPNGCSPARSAAASSSRSPPADRSGWKPRPGDVGLRSERLPPLAHRVAPRRHGSILEASSLLRSRRLC